MSGPIKDFRIRDSFVYIFANSDLYQYDIDLS